MASADIRVATAADAETLSRLGCDTFTESFGHLYSAEDLDLFLTGKHSVEAYAALLADDQSTAWIADDDHGEAIGYLTATPCGLPVPDIPKRAGEVQRFYILEDRQGGGLGGRMLNEALAWMAPRFDPIYLSVYAENFGAQQFYERCGFVKIHKYDYLVGNQADPEWIMEWRPG